MTHPLKRWLTAAAWAYFTILFGWLALYLATGDRLAPIALVNSFGVYLFFPLPLAVAVAAWVRRRRELWAALLVGLAAFVWLWGGQFGPRPPQARAQDRVLTVMTYNMLGKHGQPNVPIGVIRAENPDVVLIQELTPAIAEGLQGELFADYPYQVLDPQPGVWGMGVISKYPIQPTGDQLPAEWIGTPQVLALDWDGQTVTVVNFHMQPTGVGSAQAIGQNVRVREAQARAIVDYARQAGARGPVIAGGDANTTELSEAHRILTAGLRDAWQEAGFGLGHTFPGAENEWSSRPAVAGIAVPQWLVRIDYVFHSADLTAVAAHVGRFDGLSDHRGVVVRLVNSEYTDSTD